MATEQSKATVLKEGLQRLSNSQLKKLSDAANAELQRRLEDERREDDPSKMTDEAFRAWANDLMDAD